MRMLLLVMSGFEGIEIFVRLSRVECLVCWLWLKGYWGVFEEMIDR